MVRGIVKATGHSNGFPTSDCIAWAACISSLMITLN